MTLKAKSWIWWLTFPFAHNNYTTIGSTLYHPKGNLPPAEVVAHEKIHESQMRETGLFRFLFLYLFALPFLWNPWRFRWEFEAYLNGSHRRADDAIKILRSFRYGWLTNRAPKDL